MITLARLGNSYLLTAGSSQLHLIFFLNELSHGKTIVPSTNDILSSRLVELTN